MCCGWFPLQPLTKTAGRMKYFRKSSENSGKNLPHFPIIPNVTNSIRQVYIAQPEGSFCFPYVCCSSSIHGHTQNISSRETSRSVYWPPTDYRPKSISPCQQGLCVWSLLRDGHFRLQGPNYETYKLSIKTFRFLVEISPLCIHWLIQINIYINQWIHNGDISTKIFS
jgi:hypothetical protein